MRCALGLMWATMICGCVGTFDPSPPRSGQLASFEPAIDPPGSGRIDIPPLPAGAICQGAPPGRAYVGLAGEPLDADRDDSAALVDTRRTVRNYKIHDRWSVLKDLESAVSAPENFKHPLTADPGVDASFGMVEGSYSKGEVGPFAVYVTFTFAFDACLSAFEAPSAANKLGWYEHVVFEPTAERARQFCQKAEKSAWLRLPTEAEVSGCVDLALNLSEETDIKKRWAYVCAAVVSSANWLSL